MSKPARQHSRLAVSISRITVSIVSAMLFFSPQAQAVEKHKEAILTFSTPHHEASQVFNGATLLSMYGESDVYAVRWPNGVVYVQDDTHYPYLEQVLGILNRDLGQVHLEKAPYPDVADIHIEWADLDGPCGTTVTSMDASHRAIGSAKIRISNLFRNGKACTGNTQGFPLYLHEMAHAIGFSRHTREGSGLMDSELVMNANLKVTPAFRTFFKTLYALPAGSMIPERFFPDTKEDLSATSVSLFMPKSFYDTPKETFVASVAPREKEDTGANVRPLIARAPDQVQKLEAYPSAPEALPRVMLRGKHFVKIRYVEEKTAGVRVSTPSGTSEIAHGAEAAGFFWKSVPAVKIKSRVMEFGSPSVVMTSMEKKSKHSAKRIKNNNDRLF